MEYLALYPGSFDPFTRGHLSIALKAVVYHGSVIIAVGDNADKKNPVFAEKSQRVRLIEESINDLMNGSWLNDDSLSKEELLAKEMLMQNPSRIKVIEYSGMHVDAALKAGARCIIYGVRNSRDREAAESTDYFNQLLLTLRNKKGAVRVYPLEADEEMKYVSSTAVRNLCAYGEYSAAFALVMPSVFKALMDIYLLKELESCRDLFAFSLDEMHSFEREYQRMEKKEKENGIPWFVKAAVFFNSLRIGEIERQPVDIAAGVCHLLADKDERKKMLKWMMKNVGDNILKLKAEVLCEELTDKF